VETGCRGGQGSPRALAPTGRQAGRWYDVNIYLYIALRFLLVSVVRSIFLFVVVSDAGKVFSVMKIVNNKIQENII
jgi:hypothetical protein